MGAVSASPQQLAWNMGTTGRTMSQLEIPMASGALTIIECRTFDRCEYTTPLGFRSCRCVAHAAAVFFIERLPAEVIIDFGNPVFVADGVRATSRACEQHQWDDIAFDPKEGAPRAFQRVAQSEVDQHDPIFGVVNDPGDLLWESAG